MTDKSELVEVSKKLEKLKLSRTGKKSSITKRLELLNRLVSEGGSRTKIKSLLGALIRVFGEIQEVCQEISSISDIADENNSLDEIKINIDNCCAEAEDYLEQRKDEKSSSSESRTKSWVDSVVETKQHEVDTLTGDLSRFSFETSIHNQGFGSNFPTSTNAMSQQYDDGLFNPTRNFNGSVTSAGPTPVGQAGYVPVSSTSFDWNRSVTLPDVPAFTSGQTSGLPGMSTSNLFGLSAFSSWRDPNCNLDPRSGARRKGYYQNGASAGTTTFTTANPLFSQLPSSGLNQAWMSSGGQGASNMPQLNSGNLGQGFRQRDPMPNLHTNPSRSGRVQRTAANDQNRNDVDSWIDDLDENVPVFIPNLDTNGISPNVQMAWLVQQNLPRAKILNYNGSPTEWVEFITKFRDLVHNQRYLNDTQRSTFLLQHLEGEAKRSVRGYATDRRGYVLSLKRLKYLFGQKSRIAQATLQKVTQGKVIQNDDLSSLVEFYYTISDCLVTLRQLNYASDIYSSDTLRQAVRRLPQRLMTKWAEHSFSVRRRQEEPNLLHFEEWLQARVLAQKEAYLPEKQVPKKKPEHVGTLAEKTPKCELCQEDHSFWKCIKYKKLSPSDKFDYVKNAKRCFNCLGAHPTKTCWSKGSCFAPSCKKRHHTTLHPYFSEKEEKEKREKEKEKKKEKEKDKDEKNDPKEEVKEIPIEKKEFNGVTNSQKEVYLQVVPVMLHTDPLKPPQKSLRTYALLDNGSQNTMLRDDVARELGAEGITRTVHIETVKDKSEKMTIEEVKLEVSNTDGNIKLPIPTVYVVSKERFNMPARPSLKCPDPDIYRDLEGIELDCIKSEEISILIGANVPTAFLVTDSKYVGENQPLALKTMFGWTLFGFSTIPTHICTTINAVPSHVNLTVEKLWVDEEHPEKFNVNTISVGDDGLHNDGLHEAVEKFWAQDQFGILPIKDNDLSREDIQALETLEKETKFTNGRYQVPMLWEDQNSKLPDNFVQAQKRYSFLKKRFKSNSGLHQKYKAVMDDYISKGYARKMSKEQAKRRSKRTWHLPTHPVVNPNKPDTVRVVNDAKAEHEGASLNKSLVTGPDLLNSLVGNLLRFRRGKVAIVADIEAMFHQVPVSEEDADSLRFLWQDDINSNEPPDIYQMMVHIFGAKDSPTCANYALKRVARDNQEDFSPMTFEAVLNSFYVDDLLKSLDSVEDAIQISKELMELLQRGGFRLTKFISNYNEVLEALPATEVLRSKSMSLDKEKLERALGVYWDIEKDVFTFVSTNKSAPNTKRGILRVVSSLFDPLGFLTPFVLKAKLLIQELWRSGNDWDSEVDGTVKKAWDSWIESLKKVSSVTVDRCFLTDFSEVTEVQLHIFCDASESSFGAVAYLRFSLKKGDHRTSFVMSKSKLAPIKSITLPRLELNAAVVGSRLFRTIIYDIDLPVQRVVFWTDSTLTLQYIRNKKHRFKVYVANRVREVLETSSDDQWYFVPGNQNPADLLTREVSDPASLMQNNKNGINWFQGPTFLQEEEECWPTLTATLDESSLDGNPEIKAKRVFIALASESESFIDFYRFSKWSRLKRAVGWINRFVDNARAKKFEDKRRGCLISEELKDAENFICKIVQAETYQKEISALRLKKALPSSQLSSLCPYLDSDALLLVGGRLEDANLCTQSKHQVILPKESPVSKLIVQDIHEKNGHVKVEHTLAETRTKYWINGARYLIKSIIRIYCQIQRAKKRYPYMADLPKGRVACEESPFTHTGVDLFGPHVVKQGRKQLKRWVALFTCLTVRCVHLEVVETPETDPFINCIRRFVNRRGSPKVIYSDCGSNFIGTTNELEEISINRSKVSDFASEFEIYWDFNPPSAPHMGGVWERLVRSVKDVLSGILKCRVPTDPQLYTLLTEVESIVNSRPLTYISTDPDDLEALTPNHILIHKHRDWTHIAGTGEADLNSRKQWRQVQAMTQAFWERWRREYLPTITKRSKCREKERNVKEGELVILSDDKCKRKNWPLARIIKVMPGKDGVVRVVEVKTKDGIYTRPVSKLYTLEENEVPQGEGHVTNC